MQIKIESEDIFTAWKLNWAEEIGAARFTRNTRLEMIEDLANEFFKHGVDHDEAKRYESRLLKFLITKEGEKGTGKYKNWKENVKDEWKAVLFNTYQQIAQVIENTKKEEEIPESQEPVFDIEFANYLKLKYDEIGTDSKIFTNLLSPFDVEYLDFIDTLINRGKKNEEINSD